jgi:hypothetical protein
VTADGPFAYVQFGCGHVTISREDDKIIFTAGPGCKLDNHEFVEINVVADQCPGSPLFVRRVKTRQRSFNAPVLAESGCRAVICSPNDIRREVIRVRRMHRRGNISLFYSFALLQ